MSKKVKEQVEEKIEEDLDRSHLNIQQFMNDMQLLSDQAKDRNVVKPVFDYGSLEVLAYLQWLILGELQMLNNKLEEEE